MFDLHGNVRYILPFHRAAVAQLDRASDYGSEGLGFESLRLRHSTASTYKEKKQKAKKRVWYLLGT